MIHTCPKNGRQQMAEVDATRRETWKTDSRLDERNLGCSGRDRTGRVVKKNDNFGLEDVSDVKESIHTHIYLSR
jgi:hypothetical protein